MRHSTKRRALNGLVLAVLLVCVWHWLKPGAQPEISDPRSTSTPQTVSPQTQDPLQPGRVTAVNKNPIKVALKNSSWQIVTRGPDDREAATADETTEGSLPPDSHIPGTRAKLSLEFVRADFNAAGMRGVRQFAAFSPPQFDAIKKALAKRKDTEISAAPPEFAAAGETIGFDLNNAADGSEFSIDLSPKVSPDGQSIQLRTTTNGTRRTRNGTLPIWDGQTVMIPLGETAGKRQTAAFITVRLTNAKGEPVNEFVVKR